jgi:hypothetical protein
LKTQLENHKEALYSLYATHEKLRKQYRHLCNLVCDKLEETEDYVAQRAQQSHLLESREREIFQLWERIKDLEQYKLDREEVDGEEEEEGLEVENPTKRIKSQETDDSRIRRSSFDSASEDSLQQLAHKRKHHETVKDTSSPKVVTMKSQTKSSDQEDMFYQQHKGFSVDLDLLLPQKLSGGKGKVAMMVEDEVEREEEFSPPLTFSSRKKDQMSDEEQEMRHEEEEQETIESLVDANPEDDLQDEEFGEEEEDEEEMEEEHPPKELEELQESPIYKQTRDQSTGDDEDNLEDSADSLFGLNAALSPVLNSDYFNKTVTQNLFGKDESPQMNQMQHFKSQDVDHSNEPNEEDEDDDDMLLEITKSNDGSHLRSTGGKSLPLFSLSKSAANISARKFLSTESSTQTDSLASTAPLMSPKPPTRSHTIQTDVIPSRDAWAQVKLSDEEKKPPTPSSSNRLSPIPFKSFGKDAACQVELILPTPPPTPSVSIPVPAAVPAVAVSSDLKKKKADPPVVSQKSVFDKEQLEIDSNYIQDMEAVHYTVGETLMNLEFEKERALKHFKSKMKHLLLSSAVKGGGKEVSTASPDYHEMKDKKREVLQEMSPAESKEERISSQQQQPISSSTFPYNISEKELFEKQLFTYKEKVFYLEKEKEQKEEEINLLKLNYLNEKNLLEVQVQELTKNNKEFIYLMNEMKKPTKEMSIQTDNTGRKKKYQMKIHHYGEQQEESESEIDSDEENGEDELSRLLFKEVNRSNSKFLNKSKMGKMEIFQPTDEKGEEEGKKRQGQVSAANSLFQGLEEEHDQQSSDEENLVPQNSSLRSLPSLNNSTILLDGSNLDYEEDQQDQQQQQNISKLSLNETFPEHLEEEEKPPRLLVPPPASPSTTLIRIPTPGQKNRKKFFEETEIAAVVQQSSPSLQKQQKKDERNASSMEEKKGDQSYEELFHSRPATTSTTAVPRSSFPSSFPTAHPPQSSQKESNSSNSSVNTSIFIKEHTYEHTGFITNYELYEDDHSNRNQHQSAGKSADGSRRSSIATVEEEEESEEEQDSEQNEEKEGGEEEEERRPSEYREIETTENKFGFDSSSYDEYLQKNFQDLENDFEKELLAIKEENSSMMMGKEGIAFNEYDEMQEEEKDWSNKFEQKQQRLEKEKQEKEEFQEKQRRAKERMKEDHEEKEFEANIHRIMSATDKLNDHKQFIEKVNDTTNPEGHETGGMMRSPVTKSSLSPKHYEIQDYSLLSSDYQKKLEDLKLKKAALLLAAASEEKKSPSTKSHRRKYNNNQTVALVDEENKLNLESFEVMRIEWENQQLLNKQQELIRENQVILKKKSRRKCHFIIIFSLFSKQK